MKKFAGLCFPDFACSIVATCDKSTIVDRVTYLHSYWSYNWSRAGRGPWVFWRVRNSVNVFQKACWWVLHKVLLTLDELSKKWLFAFGDNGFFGWDFLDQLVDFGPELKHEITKARGWAGRLIWFRLLHWFSHTQAECQEGNIGSGTSSASLSFRLNNKSNLLLLFYK